MNEKRWYHTDDYHSPRLSRNSLGEFLYQLLKENVEIGTIWPFNIYDRSPIYFTVKMTEETKNKLESKLKNIKFVDPPNIVLN